MILGNTQGLFNETRRWIISKIFSLFPSTHWSHIWGRFPISAPNVTLGSSATSSRHNDPDKDLFRHWWSYWRGCPKRGVRDEIDSYHSSTSVEGHSDVGKFRMSWRSKERMKRLLRCLVEDYQTQWNALPPYSSSHPLWIWCPEAFPLIHVTSQ